MGLSMSPLKYIEEFDYKDLHKKVGKLIVLEPTESDTAEGNGFKEVWFMDEDLNMYLIKKVKTIKLKDCVK